MKNHVVGEGEPCCVQQDPCYLSNTPMATSGPIASAELQTAHSNARINVCDFKLLHNYFLHMFETSEETQPVKDKGKKSKKSKKTAKSRDKRQAEPLSTMYYSVPEIRVSRNASWFAMFASVRQTCLEHQSRAASILQVAAANAWQDAADTDPDTSDSDSGKNPLPRVVGLGLRAVFDMIRETETTHPAVCRRGLQSLLDVLQGLQPEDLRDEPGAVMETMFTSLLELSSLPGTTVSKDPGSDIRSLACSCLLAMAVAGGSTAHLLRATAALLMSPRSYAAEMVSMPGILASLQRSVFSLLIRRTVHPDYMSHGVPVSSLVDTFPVNWREGATAQTHPRCHSLASDGFYLYLHSSSGLYKIGSGFSGTMKGHVYHHKAEFFPEQRGWLGFASNTLFLKKSDTSKFELVIIDRESLEVVKVVTTFEKYPAPHLMLSDGESIGLITASRDDTFTIKFLSPLQHPMVTIGELPLKLARKCVEVVGTSIIDEGGSGERVQVDFGVDDEVVMVGAGKEFALMLTNGGKLYYTGKSTAISHKQPCPPGRWNEVMVSKSGTATMAVTQFSIGHDGQHALLVTEDGSVYFTGTARRGEDADHQSKPRRQPKPTKPKKMSRLEGQTVVTTACNSATSCIVTKKGELFIFGKDSSHTDFSTGQVTDLNGHHIIAVAAGKAHIVVLSSNHEVFTFGMNNKGQCGREFPLGAGRPEQAVVAAEGEETSDHEDATEGEQGSGLGEVTCPLGKHKWKHDQCMICVFCGECTGYGAGCVSASRPDRNPGMLCGCGSGDSGCGECGVCRVCAGEVSNELEGVAAEVAGPASARELIRLDLLAGGGGGGGAGAQQVHDFARIPQRGDHRDKLIKRRIAKMSKDVRRNRKYSDPIHGDIPRRGNAREVQREEGEREPGKITSLGPGRVPLPHDCRVTQVSCGLHHTLLLTSSGQVLTFGSNSHGQLGSGDLTPKGAPTPVQNIPERVTRVAAGSYHSVALTASGRVFTWGSNAKNQLGRVGPSPDPSLTPVEVELWFSMPGPIPGLGPSHGKTVTWVAATADQTILKLDESLINVQNLEGATLCANRHHVLLLPTHNQHPTSFHSLAISRSDGFCRSFTSPDQVEWGGRSASLDPLYNVVWSLCNETGTIQCHNPTCTDLDLRGRQCILSPDLALPITPNGLVSRSQAALNLLSCLDTITGNSSVTLSHHDEECSRGGSIKAMSKEDYAVVNRFDSHGGGWGYSGHSIEAVRFSVDTDILLGGFGLFGGRGEYVGKIKLFDIGLDGGDQEGDGDLLAESEEVTYECGARQKYPILFEEPVAIVAGKWYIAWARVSGPSSDCGSSGQSQVTTEDQIQFTFKSSKKSNNGTDVNAGQLPQILYKIVAQETATAGRRYEPPEPVYILSNKFGRPLTTESFQSLLSLLQWAWSTFKVSVAEVVDTTPSQAALMDLQRLVFICRASLRLLVSYIGELYPPPQAHADKEASLPSMKPVAETQRLAECVYEVRTQLVSMLADPLPVLSSVRSAGQLSNIRHQTLNMADVLLQDAHTTFVSCFHAFYPTGPLKWVCFCSLLSSLDTQNCDRLLAAVIDALCNPMIKLRNTFPFSTLDSVDRSCGKVSSPVENISVSGSMVQLGEMTPSGARFPILAEVMNYQSHADAVKFGPWNFGDVLNRLLSIVSLPVKQALQGERVTYRQDLVTKTCRLIACVVSELSNLKGGPESNLANLANRVPLITPNRFTRASNSRTWNTGNGSPDAICFSVDKTGILIAGATVYGGVGSFDYEMELLHDQSSGDKDSSQGQRWNSMEMCHGTYNSEDCANDIALIKFDKPVGIQPFSKYALRLRNHGARTSNGDAGQSTVKGTDGTTFTFTSCSLSFNGTNPTRGQLPQILYYSSPSEEPAIANSTANLAQTFSRQSALSMTVSIVHTVTQLLSQAASLSDGLGQEVLNSAPVVTSLLPHIMASVAGISATDPAAAVQVLSLVQDLLPSVSAINNQSSKIAATCPSPLVSEQEIPSPHYAWVECEHPYKTAGVSNYRVVFPQSVRWMAVEFDAACCTAQPEDTLQLYIRNPASRRSKNHASPVVTNKNSEAVKSQKYNPVLGKFSGNKGWPTQGVVLPGNEVLFSLETASDYVKADNKITNYGFRCLVTGYECQDGSGDGLRNLEHELAYLGGLCAASLLNKTIKLPPVSGEEVHEDAAISEEIAQELSEKHPTLLSKGFALDHPPNIHQALAGYIPFSCQSHERLFLKDFVQCTPGTAGGRLAAWLQPESFISVENCGVTFRPEELRCSWPSIITVITRDQYGATAHVPNMKVEVKAVPIDEMNASLATSSGQAKLRKLTQPDSMTFGGHPPPNLETKYEVTIKDKMFYHAITVSKSYDNYSFEELRYASPKLQRQSENMLVRPNSDGTYSANWTPGNVGWYRLLVSLDGCELPASHRVEVLEPPQGKVPPNQQNRKTCSSAGNNQIRKFVAKPSAGLRVRLHPTLQSEQIGIIPVDATLSIVDELPNSDGVWVRLSAESMAEYCPPSYVEGWCLQYNQHFSKQLLVQVVEPLPEKRDNLAPLTVREICQLNEEAIAMPVPSSSVFSSGAPSGSRDRKRGPRPHRGPGLYTVVKCGASGHNIRCGASLNSAPVGMLSLGDNILVTEVREFLGSSECWVRLDQESAEKLCFAVPDGETWCQAVSATGTHFLESEAEIQEQRWPDQLVGGNLDRSPGPYMSPFRLSDGAHNVWAPGVPALPSQTMNTPFSTMENSMSTTMSPKSVESTPSVPLHRRKSLPRPVRPTTPPRQGATAAAAIGVGKAPNSPTFPRGRAGSVERKSFFQKWFKGEDEKRPSRSASPPSSSRKSSPGEAQRKPTIPFNKDIPPELQGVSVKELVKVIGASRANGNGITPPGTPGTPRRASRSASPAGPGSRLACSSSRSSSPISIGHGRGIPPSLSPKTPRSVSASAASVGSVGDLPSLARQNSSTSDTSALVSSLTRDMSGMSASPSLTRELSASPSRQDGSVSPVSLRSDHVRSESPAGRLSSPRQSETKDSLQIFNMSTTSMEVSRDSLKDDPVKVAVSPSQPQPTPVKPRAPERCSNISNNVTRATPQISRPSAPTPEYIGPVVEAMSPSVAESIRSVFAAFIWHAGIVQDTMSCASFLKFNSGMTKQGSGSSNSTVVTRDSNNTREARARQRHSVEVISTAYLNYKDIDLIEKSAVNANTNRNVARNLLDAAGVAGVGETIPEEREDKNNGETESLVPGLAPTLGQLVLLWENIVLSCLDTIVEQTALNTWSKERTNRLSSHIGGKTNLKTGDSILDKASAWSPWVPDKDKGRVGERLILGVAGVAGSAPPGGPGYCQSCDMCGEYYDHPVTYHMKMAHPGCGGHAGGRGYNSGGQYCGGWAGNCGDGGVGGSSWYLLCENCRENHVKAAKQKLNKPGNDKNNHKLKGKRHNAMPPLTVIPSTNNMVASFSRATASSPVGPGDCHMVMKANAMFLLDLASSVQQDSAGGRRRMGSCSHSGLATVAELTPGDPGPFPYTPFQCLEALGVQDSQLKELNDELMLEESWRNSGEILRDGSVEPAIVAPQPVKKVDIDGNEEEGNIPSNGGSSEKEIEPPEEFQSGPSSNNETAVVRRNKFHRSISIGSPKGKEWSPPPSGNRVIMNRKRNSSYEDSSTDHHNVNTADFLSHTSPAWKKLFEGGRVATGILDSPVLSFLLQWNDLDSLQIAMQLALRKAVCRNYAMQAFTWLIRSVSQPVCLHDLLWCLVSALQKPPKVEETKSSPSSNSKKEKDEANKDKQEDEAQNIATKEREEGFEHPMTDLSLVGGAIPELPATFHTLLQTISDLMLLLPLGSALQQAAITCFAIKFWPSDHPFLHQSHVFSTISKILSRGEGELEVEHHSPLHGQQDGCVEKWADLTSQTEVTVSSRQAMLASLTDGSTETFWESGDEDRNKTKWVGVKLPVRVQARSVAIHVDNGRDIGNKVGSLTFKTGKNTEEMVVLKNIEVETRFAGWITCFLDEGSNGIVRVEVRGPDNTVRVRQVRVVGRGQDVASPSPPGRAESHSIQQANCEAETLRVFRLVTSQVFGKLLEPDSVDPSDAPTNAGDSDGVWDGASSSGADLKEHVVGILFSRQKLSHLQKQVCSHIVVAIAKEASCMRDDWELSLCSGAPQGAGLDEVPKISDTYCFEMLSMVLALSGSRVGRTYLAHQYSLLQDLLSLLHTGSARVQRAVIAVLKRVLPLVQPARLANILSVPSLPPRDFSILTAASLASKDKTEDSESQLPPFDMHKIGILDIFLSCIAKALTLQVKSKSGGGRSVSTVSLASSIHPRAEVGGRWWLRGSLSKKIAEDIIGLLKDMTQGQFGEEWTYVSKSAIAEAILNLTRLEAEQRQPEEGTRCGTVWLAVAALCVLDRDHVEGLSSGEWAGGGNQPERPTCHNHDDDETVAIILCDTCGNLCADCDRFLHLHRRTRHHSRQVFKEEEEAIKVNLHEGCGRTKLYWLTAAADSATLKGMVEFRDGTAGSSRLRSSSSAALCRFCGGASCAALPVLDGVCTEEECQSHAATACTKILGCGHPCGGISGESPCLPCLQGCDKAAGLKQDADDMCMICFTEPLSPIPSIQLECGHVFHLNCCLRVLEANWAGPRITFGFTNCPICKVRMNHQALKVQLEPINELYEDVRKKALMRLEYEGLSKSESIVSEGARFHNDPAGFAMERYAYYVCFKCGKAYFGGEARCDMEGSDTYNREELVCGGCSDVSQAQMCPKHGTDYLEYKCRYCCSVAVFFCFGTTHFCNACHDDFQRVANIPKAELPQCPVAPKALPMECEECPLHVKHPATGEEFALGCGVCRNAHTF